MPISSAIYTIVLAAGKGRRMRSNDCHKVCFDVAGVPAILRSLDTYNRIGAVQNVVVVGELAGQVVETVGRKFHNAVFAYQPDPLGTGDAARCGLQALAAADDDAHVLVVAGDKIISNTALTRLIAEFNRSASDLQILCSPAATGGGSAGRILFDEHDRPAAIAETADIHLRQCRSELRQFLKGQSAKQISATKIQAMIARHLGENSTPAAVFGWNVENEFTADNLDRLTLLAQLEAAPIEFPVGGTGQVISPEAALNAAFRNESVYLVRKGVLAFGLEQMRTDNAQGEQYLTDAIGAILAAEQEGGASYRVGYVATQSADEILSYNNPEELERVDEHFRREDERSLQELNKRLGSGTLRTVPEWQDVFAGDTAEAALRENYGTDDSLIGERRTAFQKTLQCFEKAYGPERHAILVRSPGRINVMGRHIDWQGGRCNLMAVNQEVLMVVSPRSDDLVNIRNVESERFPDASLSLGRLVSQLRWEDWLSVVNCGALERHLRQSAGNWSLYIEAALLRLQMAFPDRILRGMDIAVSGNIPVAAGMSSSSALVVSTAESTVALNGLDITPRQFVNFCGEGEWFVGTRGGSADHAAMKYGQRGTINHVAFHEFELLEQLSFPETHRLVVCNSFVEAKKAGGAKEAFNSRVASYLVGVELVRLKFPEHAPFVQFVRDINPDTLRVPRSKIYKILLALPEAMTAEEIRRTFADHPDTWAVLAPFFQGISPQSRFPVRGVVWFGIAECARSREAAACLRHGDMAALGELMKISHDGERCFHFDESGETTPFTADISDARLQQLIDDIESGESARLDGALIHKQPGAYRCSTREIDTIVDIALGTPGVAGAQIAGAGLGGCAMVLTEIGAVDEVEKRLNDLYFSPRGLRNGVLKCLPSAGSCVISVSENN